MPRSPAGRKPLARVDVIVGRATSMCRRPSSSSRDRRHRRLRRASDLLVLLAAGCAGDELRLAGARHARQGEHGEAALSPRHPAASVADALAARLEDLVVSAHRREAAFAIAQVRDASQALELANGPPPEHLPADTGPKWRGSLRWSLRGCVFVSGSRARPRSAIMWRAPTSAADRRLARFASMLLPRHFRRRMGEVRVQRAAGKLAAAGAPIAARGLRLHAESMEARVRENPAHESLATIERRTGRDRRPVSR